MIFVVIAIMILTSLYFRNALNRSIESISYDASTFSIRLWPMISSLLLKAFMAWLVLAAILVTAGYYTNSITSSLCLAGLSPIWFIAIIIPRRVYSSLPFIILWARFLITFVVIAISAFVMFGLWSPKTKDAFNRLVSSKLNIFETYLDKKSLSDVNTQILGKLNKDCYLYTRDFKRTNFFVNKDTIVKAIDPKKLTIINPIENEKFIYVALPHTVTKDYTNGARGYIPVRAINWDYDRGQEHATSADSDNKTKSVAAESAPSKPSVPKTGDVDFTPKVFSPVKYNHWDETYGGAISLGTFQPGSYLITFEGKIWRTDPNALKAIGPEGSPDWRVNLHPETRAKVAELPVEGSNIAGRIVKVGTGEWKFAGNSTTIKVPSAAQIFVSINLPQFQAKQFTGMGGGYDTITVKRIQNESGSQSK